MIPDSDRKAVRRVATGDRGAEHAALDADVVADALLGGHDNNVDN